MKNLYYTTNKSLLRRKKRKNKTHLQWARIAIETLVYLIQQAEKAGGTIIKQGIFTGRTKTNKKIRGVFGYRITTGIHKLFGPLSKQGKTK